ncbi:MAG TPA: energy transducer TonB [Edaphobacter sp.]|nr:energy transducer TonB [Edaphobacter sp.]
MRTYPLLWIMASMLGSHTASSPYQVTDNSQAITQTDNQAALGSEKNPLRVSSGVMAGLAIQHKMPLYPAAEGPYRSGAIVLHAIITPEGKVDKLTVISGPDSLRKRALEAVHQWVYKPYLLNGTSVWIQTTITMNLDFGG